jgi:hypothetical protein
MLIDIVVNKDYNISIESNTNNLIVYHSLVYKWNKTVRQSYIEDFNKLRSLHKDREVYTYIRVSSGKTIKFAKMLGFKEMYVKNEILYMKHTGEIAV